MYNSNLYHLFHSLSKKELRDLSKWLQSPFFNQRLDIRSLFEYLKSNQGKEPHHFEKTIIFQHIFENQAYDDAKIRYLMSFLMQQIKKYLAYRQWESQAFRQNIDLLQSLHQHHQEKLFAKQLKQLRDQFRKTQKFTHLRHFYIYQTNLQSYRSSLKKSRTEAMGLQETADALSKFFICENLRVACLMVAHKTIKPQINYQAQLLDETIEKARHKPFADLPEIAIYYNTYQALTQPEQDHFFVKLKQLITENWQRFAVDEMRDIYILAINYCIKRLNKGQTKFIREALDLYKLGLEKSILLENGELSRFTYNNVLTLSLMIEDFQWALTFLEKYKSHLPGRNKKNIYLYNLTIYHFKKQDYQRVMELLQQVQFRDVLYNLDARRMLLRSYFELGEFDALDSLLDSFQIFIRRRYDLGYHKENFMNLIRFVRKLLNIGSNKKERLALLQKVKATSAIADKDWILSKIEL